MVEAVRKIGVPLAELDIDKQSEALIQQVDFDDESRAIILDFDLEEKSINIRMEPIEEETAKRYFYIGTADGPSSPQWMITGSKPDYLISQSIPSLLKIIENDELKQLLQDTLDIFYYDYGEQLGSKERYRYILNLEKYFALDKMTNYYIESGKDIKKTVGNVAKSLTKYITDQYEVRVKDIRLWALTFNGEIIQQRKDYQSLAWNLKENHFEKTKNGVCSLCGSKTEVSSNTGKLKLNYYITQKKSFASGLEDFDKNFRLCKTCHRQLLLGEMYSIRNLNASIGKLKFLLIPEPLFDTRTTSIKIDDIHEAYKNAFSIIRFDKATDLERETMRRLRDENYNNQYTFHFLFYMKKQQEFRILQFIKDVSPSRIYAINKEISEQNRFGKRWFNWPDSDDQWILTFEQIFYLFPLHQNDRYITEHKNLLMLYDAILTKKKVNRNTITKKLNQLAKVYYLEQTKAFQLSTPKNKDISMIYGILKGMLLLRYLKNLSVIIGGEVMDTTQLTVSKDFKRFIEDIGYDEQQTSLVLLGKLIYEVGQAQVRNKLTSKPILSKINYDGMSLQKLQKLSNEVFEKLKQYKLITNEGSRYYIESIYRDHKVLFDKSMNNWKLSTQENVFYLLSGYAIGSRPIIKNQDEGDKDHEQQ